MSHLDGRPWHCFQPRQGACRSRSHVGSSFTGLWVVPVYRCKSLPLERNLNSGSKEAPECHRTWSEARAFGIFKWIIQWTQRRCSIVDKEAFPIMESLDKLRHFVLSDNRFRLFTDHRNLIFLFDPTFKKWDFEKKTVDKLCRWASKLQEFRYIIEHLPGEDNLCADMLSR
jgi:hypothetical protein